MKKNYLLIVTLVTLIIAFSCENPLNDLNVTVDSAVFKKYASVTLFDPANPTKLFGTDKLNVQLLGQDADKILTDGGSKSNFKIVDGVLQLAVNPAYTSNDINFVVKVSGNDYLTTTIPIRITEADTLVSVSANMVNLKEPGRGINVIEKNKSLSGGKLTSDFSVVTDNSANFETTEVIIKSDTEFKDENGNLIKTSGDLKVRLVNFDSQNDESLNSFPGGFSPASIELEDGTIDTEGSFATAGFSSIDMFIGNKEVKEFTKPIDIIMTIDENVINPNTGQKIKKGDKLPVWSYSKDDGKWKYHCEATVEEKNGKLFTKCETTHLSWYNLDYWIWGCNDYRRLDVKINAPNTSRSNGYRLFTKLVYAGTNQSVSYKTNRTVNMYDGKTFGYWRTPNTNLQFVIYEGNSSYAKGKEVYRSQTFNGCNTNQINVNFSEFSAKLPPAPVNVSINFSGKCGDKTIKPSSYLYMKKTYTNWWGRTYDRWAYVGYIYRGRIVLYNITLNKEYEFRTYYNGRKFEHRYTFTSATMDLTDFDIPADLCSSL